MSTNKLGPVAVSDTVLLVGGGVAIVLVLGAIWYAGRKVGQVADAAGEAIGDAVDYARNEAFNVTSNNNVVDNTVNAIGQATGVFGINDATGKPNTLGSALFEAHQWGKETFGAWW